MNCPKCSGDARSKGYRSCRVLTLMGEVVYERAYYHCDSCGAGWFPTDAEYGLEDKRSRAARELISLAGVLEPFEEGSGAVLPRMSGLKVSASTVQRVTENFGEDVAQRRAAGGSLSPQAEWEWNADAAGRKTAYVSLDATGVLQQGPHAEKAEGKMPWVGAVFNPQPMHEKRRRRVADRRYVSGLMSLAEIGEQLRRECRAVGVPRADVVVALTDGGNGLENCLLTALGGLVRDVEFILDFYHASDAIREFAKVLFPEEEARRKAQTDAWCHLLKHEGGDALLTQLEAFDLNDRSPSVREAHRSLTGYVRNNRHRMDYPTYVSRGWQIGSGMIESACKTVVGQRLKEAGMRWRERGTTSLCQARSLYKSENALWDHYWLHAA